MKRNKIRVLSSLAILGIAGISLIGCKGEAATTTTGSDSTPAVSSSAKPTTNNNGTSSVIPTTPVSGTSNGQTSSVISSTPIQNTSTSTPQVEISKIMISGNYKKSFIIGDNFSYEGLVVTKILSDNSQVVAQTSEIEVVLYSDEDCENKVENTSNLQEGTYYVEVCVTGKYEYYEISVSEQMHTITEMLEFNDSISIAEEQESTKILEKNGNSLYCTGAASTKGAITSSQSQKYTINEKVYDTRLNLKGSAIDSNNPTIVVNDGKVTNANVITLNLTRDAKVTVAARGSGEGSYRKIIISDNGSDTYSFLCEKNNPDSYTVNLKAGTYYIYADKKDEANNITAGSWYLYGIELQYDVKEADVNYSNLTIDTTNAITNFNKGSEFSKTGLVVKVDTNYGTTEEVTDYQISGYDMNTVGNQTVTITYGTLTATYDIQVINPDATTESIEVSTAASNLVYRQGEELSLSGLQIKTTDSDNLVQYVDYDVTKISHKVLNDNNEDVTDSFATLPKGSYKVELTYNRKTTSYDIVILEVLSATFSGKTEVSVGDTSYVTELIISYTDGTNTDYSKYYKTVADTTEGYTVSYYSDAACSNSFANAEAAFSNVGTVYVKCEYGSYSSVITVSVKSGDSLIVNTANAASYYAEQGYTDTKKLSSETIIGEVFRFAKNMRVKKSGEFSCGGQGSSSNDKVSVYGEHTYIEFDVKSGYTGKLSLTITSSDRNLYIYKVVNGSLTLVQTVDSTSDVENLAEGTYAIMWNEDGATSSLEVKITEMTLTQSKN